MAKILQKTMLRELLYRENYDVIAFELNEDTGNLHWNTVSTSFCCWVDDEGNRNVPDLTLKRVDFANVSHADVDAKLKQIETIFF